MRKWTMSVVVVMASVILASVAAAAEVSREDFEDLQKHVREQAKEIVQLRGRIAMLEKRVEELEEGDTDEAAKSPSDGSDRMEQVDAGLGRWESWHQVKGKWVQRDGWPVVVGRRGGVAKLQVHAQAKRSRLVYRRDLTGDWEAWLTLSAPKGTWISMSHEATGGSGYTVYVEGQGRLKLKRRDGEISATWNSAPVQVKEMRDGADPEKPVRLGIGLRKDKYPTVYVKEVRVWVGK